MNCTHQNLSNGIPYMDMELLVTSLEKKGIRLRDYLVKTKKCIENVSPQAMLGGQYDKKNFE